MLRAFRARWQALQSTTQVAVLSGALLAALIILAILPIRPASQLSALLDNPVSRRWLAGVLVSLVLGGEVTALFVHLVRRRVRSKPPKGPRVSPVLTGAVERLFFFFFVAFDLNGTGTAMIAWIGLKMGANWNTKEAAALGGFADNSRGLLNERFTALLGGLVAMFFATWGGIISRPNHLVQHVDMVIEAIVVFGVLLAIESTWPRAEVLRRAWYHPE